MSHKYNIYQVHVAMWLVMATIDRPSVCLCVCVCLWVYMFPFFQNGSLSIIIVCFCCPLGRCFYYYYYTHRRTFHLTYMSVNVVLLRKSTNSNGWQDDTSQFTRQGWKKKWERKAIESNRHYRRRWPLVFILIKPLIDLPSLLNYGY